MESIELEVSKRPEGAKAHQIRRDGRIPGVFYGAGGPSVSVSVDARTFERSGLRSGGAHMVKVMSDDSALAGGLALVKAVQINPVTGATTHVDLLRVDVNKPVTASVGLNFVGKSAGVGEGGILQPIRRELEVRALPSALPESLDVDVTALGVGDSIHVEDLTLPEGIEAIFTENFTLVTIVPPTVSTSSAGADEGGEAGGESAGE